MNFIDEQLFIEGMHAYLNITFVCPAKTKNSPGIHIRNHGFSHYFS